MINPVSGKSFANLSHTERTINFIADNGKALSPNDLLHIYVIAQTERNVQDYREKAESMSVAELRAEGHDSGKLGEHMTRLGDPRPNELCEAHAIVSGGHAKAAVLRLILAKRGRRIDDPVNGCWLPKNTAAKAHMPARLANAVPHSRIHRHQYYNWLSTRITLASAKSTHALDCLLVHTASALQSGAFPKEVMLAANVKHGAF